MTDNRKPPKGRTPEQTAAWRAVRSEVVPTQLLNPINALEAEIGSLEPLLNPAARKSKSFVERYNAERTPDQTKQAFEAIVTKVEQVCRHARKERRVMYDEYNIPVLQPMFDRLAAPVMPNEYARSMPGAFSPNSHWVRAKQMESIQKTLSDYADEFAHKVNIDKLWNAYRIDFRGKTRDDLATHAFMSDYPKTGSMLRSIARLNKMQRLLRVMNEGTQEQIMTATGNFLKQFPDDDALRTRDFMSQCELLAGAALDRLSLDDASLAQEDEKFSRARTTVVRLLASEVAQQRIYYGIDGISDTSKHLHARQFKQDLLEAYRSDARELNKSKSGRERAIMSLKSASHIGPLISYLRAEAALRGVNKTLEKHSRTVISMYPVTQQQGWVAG